MEDDGEEYSTGEEKVGKFQESKFSSSIPGGENDSEPVTVESNTDAQPVHLWIAGEVTAWERHGGDANGVRARLSIK